MQIEKLKVIEQKMTEVFKGIDELHDLIDEKTLQWADEFSNSENEESDNFEVAILINSLGENLIDYGKMFR